MRFERPSVLSTIAGMRPLAVCRTIISLSTRRGAATLTIDVEEPLLFLLILGDVDFVRIVLDAELFERAGDLVAVGCAGRISQYSLAAHSGVG